MVKLNFDLLCKVPNYTYTHMHLHIYIYIFIYNNGELVCLVQPICCLSESFFCGVAYIGLSQSTSSPIWPCIDVYGISAHSPLVHVFVSVGFAYTCGKYMHAYVCRCWSNSPRLTGQLLMQFKSGYAIASCDTHTYMYMQIYIYECTFLCIAVGDIALVHYSKFCWQS